MLLGGGEENGHKHSVIDSHLWVQNKPLGSNTGLNS